MKKLFNIVVPILLTIGLAVSCKCTQDKANEAEIGGAEATVENLIALDRQAMYMNHANDYRWYETCIKLKNWLDEENDGAVDMVANIFQAVEERESGSFDTFVYKYQHFSDGTVAEDSIHDFWIENWPLEEEAIVVTFKEAFDLVMQTNYPKPHTHNVVLRKEVGPNVANPQWIFGNLRSQLYVDAVTGEVSPTNPAFNGLNLGTPLGEWP